MQKLYWAAAPTWSVFDQSGTGNTAESRGITAAESHDGVNTTYEGLADSADGVDLNGSGWSECDQSVTSAAAQAAIAFVRIRAQARVQKTFGTGTVSGSWVPRINGVVMATPVALSADFVDAFLDFPVDPADGQPWTNSKINAQTFGVRLTESTGNSPDFNVAVEVRLSEFWVEIWNAAGFALPGQLLVDSSDSNRLKCWDGFQWRTIAWT